MNGSLLPKPVPVTGVWLLGDGRDAVVRVEVDGRWVDVIRERLPDPGDGELWPVSHIVEPDGIRSVMQER